MGQAAHSEVKNYWYDAENAFNRDMSPSHQREAVQESRAR